MAASKLTELASQRTKELGLSPQVEAALANIQAELAAAYRESFTEMVSAIQEQASALNRIQNTLNLLIQALAPTLGAHAPPAIRIAAEGDAHPDLASAVVVADPIGQGYTLSQTNLAKALGVPATDLSIGIKALKLSQKAELAVEVRKGRRSGIVNYHPRAIAAFRTAFLEASLTQFTGNDRSALRRLKEKLAGTASAP